MKGTEELKWTILVYKFKMPWIIIVVIDIILIITLILSRSMGRVRQSAYSFHFLINSVLLSLKKITLTFHLRINTMNLFQGRRVSKAR